MLPRVFVVKALHGGELLRIRNFEPKDLDRVMKISREGNLEGTSAIYLEVYEMCPEGFLVAEVGSYGVVGFVVVLLSTPAEGRIFAIAVDRDFRERGIATELLNAAFDILMSWGAKSVRLEVRVNNYVARRLYRKLGFSDFGYVPAYYSDGEAAILMRKPLSDKAKSSMRA
ncbi:MAG: ribosomal-protein-alanine N-acetyltransferase [Candidatus Alkanophagales archaeon]|nr:MAG: ribosomal-protein-alanine N-acetyltransferase [Candidatus Alkanophagales archaeon]